MEKKLTAKQINKMVEQSYYRSCHGIMVNVMDLDKVFRAGAAAVREGQRDAQLDASVRAFVDTIKMGA